MEQLISQLNAISIQNKTGDAQERLEIIKKYAKSVLDLTWVHETRLAEENFKSDSALAHGQMIFSLFDAVEELCNSIADLNCESSDKKKIDGVLNVLGLDYAECLTWRRGSLKYAICSCKYQDDAWLADEDHQELFLRFALDGIDCFKTLFSLRKKIDDFQNIDRETDYLTTNSIFSDNHLLAAMYTGELCFWYRNCSKKWSKHLFEESQQDMDKIGIELLKVYINSVEKYGFKEIGWNCDKAHLILTQLESRDAES